MKRPAQPPTLQFNLPLLNGQRQQFTARAPTSKGETLCSACSRRSEATIWGSERYPGQTLSRL